MREAQRRPRAAMWREIDGLRQQTVGQLKVKYRTVFGQESRSNHKQFLLRRIAWRLQANAEGGLSERARQRALALAEERRSPNSGAGVVIERAGKPERKKALRSPPARPRAMAQPPVPRPDRIRRN